MSSTRSQPGEFVASIQRPRAIIILVQAGKPVDDTIATLSAFMEPGDLLIDGGNEWFPNTLRRGGELAPRGLLYMGMGVSGGEEGARHGPSLMPGGPREAYDQVRDVLEAIAAKVRALTAATARQTAQAPRIELPLPALSVPSAFPASLRRRTAAPA